MQIILVLFCAVYVWYCRADLMTAMSYVWAIIFRRCHASKDTGDTCAKFRKRVDDDFAKWRLDTHNGILKAVMPALSFYALISAIFFKDATVEMLLNAGPWGFLYVHCVLLVCKVFSSQRAFNLTFVYYTIISCLRLYLEYESLTHFSKDMNNEVRPALRILVTLGYLDYRISVFPNMLLALIQIVLNAMSQGASSGEWAVNALAELFVFVFTMIIAYVVEESGRSLIAHRIESNMSKGAWRAVAAILTGLCDAVVHLDSDLQIIGDCPQLGHLLMLDVRASHRSEGRDFLRHVAQEDRQVFVDFIELQGEAARTRTSTTSSTHLAGGGPVAIHVNLKDAMGASFRVEVFHTYLSNLGDDGHLLGIRDIGDYKKEAPVECESSQTQIRVNHPGSFSACSDSMSSGSCGSDPDLSPISKSGLNANRIQSLSLLVDAFDANLPVMEAVIRFQDFDKDASDQQDDIAPTLSSWLPSGKFENFRNWVQSSMNAYEHGRRVQSYGQVNLRLLGSAVRMSAQRANIQVDEVSADETEEQTNVRVHFEALALHLSSMLRQRYDESCKRHVPLPCIHEQSIAIRSASQVEPSEAGQDSSHLHAKSTAPCASKIGSARMSL
eukprot:TRINITY_DN42307_c0_g1_i1.p1 TRINITY_DN42307_c0_g1~~TRINITY_DN42307_c0_g1_i1.p1  ORF type:complete len:629 (-),score=44.78 TRINITY_DN42307_c0_g1_i1:58-1893(-)